MFTNHVDGGTSQVPPATPPEHTILLLRETSDCLVSDGATRSEALQPAGASTVTAEAASEEDEVAYVAVPPSESYVRSGRRADAPCVSHPSASLDPSLPVVDEEQQQGHHARDMVETVRDERPEEAQTGDNSAFPSPEMVEGPTPSSFTLAAASPVDESAPTTSAAAPAAADAQAWVVDFGTGRPKPKRKMTKKEKDAMTNSWRRCHAGPATAAEHGPGAGGGLGADSGGNTVVVAQAASALQVVHLDGCADRAALIPTGLTTTRADLEQRLVLRLPRLLCVNKQYPRGCGIASLTSVYNYLYSWLGESEVGAGRAPHSQEELMSILGFEPPFGDIAWGPFTGNGTLIRWFHALNRHFGHRGRAYILYKAHGHGKTTHLYPDNAAALVAVKAALRDPHCALIYHCHNHYMVPIGYQEIPQAQSDFFKPDVPESNCDTTIFIGEVSRGLHDAMYARRWSQIVKDVECKSPFYFNIRHPEKGVQRREPKNKRMKGVDSAGGPTHPSPQNTAQVEAAPPTVLISMPLLLRVAEANASAQQQGAGMEGVIGDAASVTSGKQDEADEESVRAPAVQADEVRIKEMTAQSTVPTDTTPGVYVVVETSTSSSSYCSFGKGSGGAEDAADAVTGHANVKEVPETAIADAQSDAVAGLLQPDDFDAASAERVASPVTTAAASDAAAAQHTVSQPPSSADEDSRTTATNAAAIPPRAMAHSSSCATADAPPRQNTGLASSSAVERPKKERGNLHCLIIFRNDQVEEQLERYEEADAEEEEQTAAKAAAFSSASSSDGSSSSDEDKG